MYFPFESSCSVLTIKSASQIACMILFLYPIVTVLFVLLYFISPDITSQPTNVALSLISVGNLYSVPYSNVTLISSLFPLYLPPTNSIVNVDVIGFIYFIDAYPLPKFVYCLVYPLKILGLK